jgi:hypothetical protein
LATGAKSAGTCDRPLGPNVQRASNSRQATSIVLAINAFHFLD